MPKGHYEYMPSMIHASSQNNEQHNDINSHKNISESSVNTTPTASLATEATMTSYCDIGTSILLSSLPNLKMNPNCESTSPYLFQLSHDDGERTQYVSVRNRTSSLRSLTAANKESVITFKHNNVAIAGPNFTTEDFYNNEFSEASTHDCINNHTSKSVSELCIRPHDCVQSLQKDSHINHHNHLHLPQPPSSELKQKETFNRQWFVKQAAQDVSDIGQNGKALHNNLVPDAEQIRTRRHAQTRVVLLPDDDHMSINRSAHKRSHLKSQSEGANNLSLSLSPPPGNASPVTRSTSINSVTKRSHVEGCRSPSFFRAPSIHSTNGDDRQPIGAVEYSAPLFLSQVDLLSSQTNTCYHYNLQLSPSITSAAGWAREGRGEEPCTSTIIEIYGAVPAVNSIAVSGEFQMDLAYDDQDFSLASDLIEEITPR